MGFFDGIGKAIGGIAKGALNFVTGNPLGVFDAVSGLFGQKESNEAQLEATRMTNEANYKIWQEQKEHNIDMFEMQNQANIDNWQMQFDKTNAYNTPLSQIERYREAGLNPSLMMRPGSDGSASSSSLPSAGVSPNSPPTMQSPPLSAYTNPISVAIDRMLQSNMQLSQIAGQDLSNDEQSIINSNLPKIYERQLDLLDKDLELKRLHGDHQRGENFVERWTRQDRVEAFRSSSKQLAADAKVAEDTAEDRVDLISAQKLEKQLSNSEKFILLKYMEPNQVVMYLQQVQNLANLQIAYKLSDKQIREIAARIGLINEQTKTQEKLTEKAGMDAWNSMEDAISKQRDNEVQQQSHQSGELLRVFESTLKQARLNADFESIRLQYRLDGWKDILEDINKNPINKIFNRRIRQGGEILDLYNPLGGQGIPGLFKMK